MKKARNLILIVALISLMLSSCVTSDGNTLFGQNYNYQVSSAKYLDRKIMSNDIILIYGNFSDFYANRLFETDLKDRLQQTGLSVLVSSDYPSLEDALSDFHKKGGKYFLYLTSINSTTYEYGGGIASLRTEAIIQYEGLFSAQDYIQMAVNVYCTGNEFEHYEQTFEKAIKKLSSGISAELLKYL